MNIYILEMYICNIYFNTFKYVCKKNLLEKPEKQNFIF